MESDIKNFERRHCQSKEGWMGYWYVTLCGPPLSVDESLLNDTDKQRCVGCQYQSMGIQEVEVTLCWPPFTIDM